MPSKNQSQHNLMQMVVARKSDKVPMSVAQEFLNADRQSGKFQGKRKKKRPQPKGKHMMPGMPPKGMPPKRMPMQGMM